MKIKLLIALIVSLFPIYTYANNVIDVTDHKQQDFLFGGGYADGIFNIGIIKEDVDGINVIRQESRYKILSTNKIDIKRTPEILEYFINRWGVEKLSKYLDSGLIHIVGDIYKNTQRDYKLTSETYLNGDDKINIEIDVASISKRYLINNNKSGEKTFIYNFTNNTFPGYRLFGEGPYPLLTILDNTHYPINPVLKVNNKNYQGKLAYRLKTYKINTPYPTKNEGEINTKISLVLDPYYQFVADIPEGEYILGIYHKSYITKGGYIKELH